MPVTSHKVSTSDGESYELRLSIPDSEITDNQLKRPILLCLPAMGVAARQYLTMAESCNQQDLICALFEFRGIDSSSVRASRAKDFGYLEILNIDLPAAIKLIREFYPNNPIYLFGHSLGGQLASLYASIHSDEITGLIGIATGSPYFKGWRFPYNLGIWSMSKLLPLTANVMGYFPGRKLGFGGRESGQLLKDWSYSVVTGKYRAKGLPEIFETQLTLLNKPVLFITVAQDILAPQSSTKNLGAKLNQCDVTYLHLQAEDFKQDSLGHFKWMKEPEPVAAKIKRWLKKH